MYLFSSLKLYKCVHIPINMADFKRQTAYKCTISQILIGNYVEQQGWEPNYLQINGNQISRINLVAVILSKDQSNILIDDGTGKIELMLFSEKGKADNLNIGDAVLIIGRPREYNSKKYIIPEIIKRIENKGWIKYRKKELELQNGKIPVVSDAQKEKIVEKKIKQEKQAKTEEEKTHDAGKNYSRILINLIRQLDNGEGADVDEIISAAGFKDTEKYIKLLINEGEIFELKPGKIKMLE